jgi:hypothetical protein
VTRVRIMSFATRLSGSEGCGGSRGDDGGQPALQFGDSSSGSRWPPILGRRHRTTAEILHPWAQDSPTNCDGNKDAKSRQIRRSTHEEGGYRPYHALKHWSEHLIPRRYPNNLSPFDIQLLILMMDEVSAFLILTRSGCREANVGS